MTARGSDASPVALWRERGRPDVQRLQAPALRFHPSSSTTYTEYVRRCVPLLVVPFFIDAMSDRSPPYFSNVPGDPLWRALVKLW